MILIKIYWYSFIHSYFSVCSCRVSHIWRESMTA